MYIATTRAIKVIVYPYYLDQQSQPEESRHVWAYTIQIENHSTETVRLLSRYWHITDGLGEVQEVRGPGVVGEHPTLEPGEAFQYTSGASLKTPSGLMQGRYTMENSRGERFDIDIPAFSLDSTEQKSRPN